MHMMCHDTEYQSRKFLSLRSREVVQEAMRRTSVFLSSERAVILHTILTMKLCYARPRYLHISKNIHWKYAIAVCTCEGNRTFVY